MYMNNPEKQHLLLKFIQLIDKMLQKLTSHCQFLFKNGCKSNLIRGSIDITFAEWNF